MRFPRRNAERVVFPELPEPRKIEIGVLPGADSLSDSGKNGNVQNVAARNGVDDGFRIPETIVVYDSSQPREPVGGPKRKTDVEPDLVPVL